jgi:cell division protein FtsB
VADPENPNLNLNHFLLLLLLLITTTTRPNNNPKMLNLFGPHLGLLMNHLLFLFLFLTELKEVVAVLRKLQAQTQAQAQFQYLLKKVVRLFRQHLLEVEDVRLVLKLNQRGDLDVQPRCSRRLLLLQLLLLLLLVVVLRKDRGVRRRIKSRIRLQYRLLHLCLKW